MKLHISSVNAKDLNKPCHACAFEPEAMIKEIKKLREEVVMQDKVIGSYIRETETSNYVIKALRKQIEQIKYIVIP